MKNKCELTVENFGPINHANINLNKINIVGGVNSTGKTLLSKLLYCLSMSLSNDVIKFVNSEVKYLFVDFKNYWLKNIKKDPINSIDYDLLNLETKLNFLIDEWKEDIIDYEYFKEFYTKFKNVLMKFNLLDDGGCLEDFEIIKNRIELYKDDFAYVPRVINSLLISEFEVNNLSSLKNSIVYFREEYDNNNAFEYKLKFKEKGMELKHINKDNTRINFKNVFYLTSLTMLEGINLLLFNNKIKRLPYHIIALQNALFEPEFNIFEGIHDDKINKICQKITEILGGYFDFDSNKNFIFKPEGNVDGEKNFHYDVGSVASGYAQIGILQKLLSNKQLFDDCVIIFDEPEANLHPKLQVDLANILVQIAKELNVLIYINSHNPIFIEAMSLYAEKFDMIDDTNFYLAQPSNKNLKYDFVKIPYCNIAQIYNNLCEPLDDLNILRNNLKV